MLEEEDGPLYEPDDGEEDESWPYFEGTITEPLRAEFERIYGHRDFWEEFKERFREEKLKESDTQGMSIIRNFVAQVSKGSPPDPDDLSFVVEAFKQILRGTPSKKALNLERRRGRLKSKDYINIGSFIWFRIRNGSTYTDATREAADRYNCSLETAKRHYSQFKSDRITIDELERILSLPVEIAKNVIAFYDRICAICPLKNK